MSYAGSRKGRIGNVRVSARGKQRERSVNYLNSFTRLLSLFFIAQLEQAQL